MLRSYFISVLCCIFIWASISTADAAHAPATICPHPLKVYLELHAPSAFQDEQGHIQGMDAEMVQAIFAKAGCQLKWVLTPMTGARIIKSLKDGDIDLMIRASKNADREQFGRFTLAYRQEIIGMYSHTASAVPAQLTLAQARKSGFSLIGPASGWYGVEFEQYRNWFRQQHRYTAYPNAVVGTDLLFATPSRGELLLIDADLFYWQLGKRQSQVRPVAALHITPAYLLTSRKTVSAATVEQLNQAIAQLTANGQLAALEQKYRSSALLQQIAQQVTAGTVQQDPLE